MKRCNLVEQAVVARAMMSGLGGELGKRQETENPEPVIDGDENHPGRREVFSVIHGDVSRSLNERSSVDKYDDGQIGARGGVGGPDVQEKAILADPVVSQKFIRPGESFVVDVLHAARAEGGAVAHSFPRLHGNRRAPAQIADRGLGVGNALERHDARGLAPDSGDFPRTGANHVALRQQCARRENYGRRHREQRFHHRFRVHRASGNGDLPKPAQPSQPEGFSRKGQQAAPAVRQTGSPGKRQIAAKFETTVDCNDGAGVGGKGAVVRCGFFAAAAWPPHAAACPASRLRRARLPLF